MTDIKLAKYSDVEGKVDKDGEKVLSDNNYTTKEKSKLEGIEEEANRYIHPAVHTADMIVGLPTKLPADGGDSATVSGFTVKSNVPANAKFTDTTYTHPKTHEASMIAGLHPISITGKSSELNNDANFTDGTYDNSLSGLTATTVKGAIDELKSLIDKLSPKEQT